MSKYTMVQLEELKGLLIKLDFNNEGVSMKELDKQVKQELKKRGYNSIELLIEDIKERLEEKKEWQKNMITL